MKICMYGFGVGNNIEPWLEFFQNNSIEHDLTFFCKSFQFDRNLFPDIKVCELGTNGTFRIKWIKYFAKDSYDLIYVQGLYDYLIIFTLFLFGRAKIKAINIWNNANYYKAAPPNKKFWQIPVYRLLYRLTDRFYFTWYGTYEGFLNKFPKQKNKLFVQPWGIRDKIFGIDPHPESEFAKSWLSSLNEDDVFIFWPEYLSPFEHIENFLFALSHINQKNKLKVLIFSGHQHESDAYVEKMRSLIRSLNLDFVELKAGTYLPYMDIMALWKRTNLTIKLSTKDQLSNGILEAMYFETPIILNNWLPYQKLKENGFDITLTELDPLEMAKIIDFSLENLDKNRDFYNKSGKLNKKLITKNFNFDKNIGQLMDELSTEIGM